MESHESKAEDLLGDGGIMKTILKEGEGWEKPRKGTEVSVHYTGTLTDGTKFDSSLDRNEFFKFSLGEGRVIKGWDETVATMKRGEKCRVVLSPEYAYGSSGSPPKIPPDSTLIFEIELVEFNNAKDVSKRRDKSVLKTLVRVSEADAVGETPSFGSKCVIKLSVKIVGDEDRDLVKDTEKSLTIGEGELPSGLEVAIKSMNLSEIASFVIQPHRIFGDDHSSLKFLDNVPLDSVTNWTIELISFEKVTPSWKLDEESKISEASNGKVRGNELFGLGKYKVALKRYQDAYSYIEYLAKDKLQDSGDLSPALQLNIAQCYLKLGKPSKALKFVDKVLSNNPDHIKGLYRHGIIKMSSKDWDVAKNDFEKVLQLDPNNVEAKRSLIIVNKEIRDQNTRDRQVYSRMFQ